MCKCQITVGGGDVLPTEVGHLSRLEQKEQVRLACQVKVKNDMTITIPEEVFGIKKWEATVVRNYNVASFIKEFVVQLPEDMDYKPGGYIQIEIPECEIDFKKMDITAHQEEHLHLIRKTFIVLAVLSLAPVQPQPLPAPPPAPLLPPPWLPRLLQWLAPLPS